MSRFDEDKKDDNAVAVAADKQKFFLKEGSITAQRATLCNVSTIAAIALIVLNGAMIAQSKGKITPLIALTSMFNGADKPAYASYVDAIVDGFDVVDVAQLDEKTWPKILAMAASITALKLVKPVA